MISLSHPNFERRVSAYYSDTIAYKYSKYQARKRECQSPRGKRIIAAIFSGNTGQSSRAWTANKNHCKSGTTGENCLVHRAVTSNSTPREITSAARASQRNKATIPVLRKSYTS